MNAPTELSDDDARLLGRYRLDAPWIFDATALGPQIGDLMDRGLLVKHWDDRDVRGDRLTEAGAAALAEYAETLTFAKANGMTVARYRQFLKDNDA